MGSEEDDTPVLLEGACLTTKEEEHKTPKTIYVHLVNVVAATRVVGWGLFDNKRLNTKPQKQFTCILSM